MHNNLPTTYKSLNPKVFVLKLTRTELPDWPKMKKFLRDPEEFQKIYPNFQVCPGGVSKIKRHFILFGTEAIQILCISKVEGYN